MHLIYKKYICISYTPPSQVDTQVLYIPMHPAKVGYNKYISRQSDRKYVSAMNADKNFVRKDFFGAGNDNKTSIRGTLAITEYPTTL